MEHHILLDDVVPKAPPAERDPVLAFPRLDAFQFLDVVGSAHIVRVFFEDGEGFSVAILDIAVVLSERPEQAFEVRGGTDRKSRRHEAGRRTRFAFFSFWSSKRNFSAGRLLPLRYSW